MAMALEFEFERGGRLRVQLLAEAGKTGQCVTSALPMEAKVYQARWSGREVFVPVNLPAKTPREHQSIRASLGDVIYFCEWGDAYDYTGFEPSGCSTARRSSGVARMRPLMSSDGSSRLVGSGEGGGERMAVRGENIPVRMVPCSSP